MTCNITQTPLYPDPLPLYTARAVDPETTSIRSAAPSYTSAAPSYHSSLPATHRLSSPPPRPPPQNQYSSLLHPGPTIGLPSPQFAPGFRSRSMRYGPMSLVHMHNDSISSWSSIDSSPQSRLYHSVAQRRAIRDSTESQQQARAAPTPTPRARPLLPMIEPTATIIEEDPYLVGGEAANRARHERLVRTRGDDILRQEDRAWDFFVSQMADWEEREKSWARFRKRMDRPGFIRRKFGWK